LTRPILCSAGMNASMLSGTLSSDAQNQKAAAGALAQVLHWRGAKGPLAQLFQRRRYQAHMVHWRGVPEGSGARSPLAWFQAPLAHIVHWRGAPGRFWLT
jgi:hypothetical protein